MKVLDKKITIDDYLEKERASETRNEFIAGEVYPLTGASFIHNLIVSNLNCMLTQILDESFYVITTDLKVWIPEKQVVDQEKIHVEQFISKERYNWELKEFNSFDGNLYLSSLGIELKISEIYKRVKMV